MMPGDLCEIGSIPLPNATWLTDAVALFQQSYGEVHPFVATMLCAVGIIMNVATVVVLTRPSMISPVNVLLCAVAICDILVMTSTLVFVVHFHFVAENRCVVGDFSYGWAVFTIVHAHVSVIFHATSIWLTVSLAQIRVLTIRRATAGPTTNITERFSIILAIVTFIIMSAVNLPNFLTFEIDEVPAEMYLPCMQIDINADASGDLFLTTSDFVNGSLAYAVRAHEEDCMKLKMAFWSNGMIFKVVPCLLLTVSIVALLKIIADVSNKRKNLAQVMKKKVPKDHTTPMLVAVLSIFLIAELPQGVMLVMTGIFSSETFKKKIYLPLGDFMDFLSLLNSAIGFLIYVGMSRKFRSVFFQLFFSVLHCSPYYSEDDEFLQNEPELSETLQLLDEKQRELLYRQQMRTNLPLATRILYLSISGIVFNHSTSRRSLPQPLPQLPTEYRKCERKLRRFKPSARNLRQLVADKTSALRRRSDGDATIVRLRREHVQAARRKTVAVGSTSDSNNNKRSQRSYTPTNPLFALFHRLACWRRHRRRRGGSKKIPRVQIQNDNPVPASIINHSDDEDAAAHIYNAYKKLSEMRERGLEADVQAITRQFPHAHRQSIYLNVEELERQRRRWSSITTGSASFATDPSGTANFFGGYVFGDLNPTLHEFSEFYAEDGDIEGNEMHQLSGPNKKLLEERRISRTDQYPSTITFGLSSFNDPPTSISQRPTTSNFLQVPGSTYTAESKRPSILSNTISTDLISTQCSHAPLVSAQQKSADKPIRLQIPARSATRRQNNPLSRFGQLILSVILWPVRLFNALQQWRADVPSVSSIRKRIGQRLLIESDKGGSPMRRLNQLQTETNFAGVVY